MSLLVPKTTKPVAQFPLDNVVNCLSMYLTKPLCSCEEGVNVDGLPVMALQA